MTEREKELIKYAVFCIDFRHKFDVSFRITKDAESKENKLFEESTQFLNTLINEEPSAQKKNELTKTEQEFIDKVKKEKQNISSWKISKSEIVIQLKDLILNGYVVNGHTWTYPFPSFALMNEIRKLQ